LKPDSRFLDLALVMGYYLELSHDLPAYGIEGACVFDTDIRLKDLEHVPNCEPIESDDETDDEAEAELLHHQHGTEEDPWAWKVTFGEYKKKNSNTIDLQRYDITKFTRAERVEAALDKKDPLADIPAKNLRRNLLDLI
jgi:hypothetical protein